jgi:hypothetical protein
MEQVINLFHLLSNESLKSISEFLSNPHGNDGKEEKGKKINDSNIFPVLMMQTCHSWNDRLTSGSSVVWKNLTLPERKLSEINTSDKDCLPNEKIMKQVSTLNLSNSHDPFLLLEKSQLVKDVHHIYGAQVTNLDNLHLNKFARYSNTSTQLLKIKHGENFVQFIEQKDQERNELLKKTNWKSLQLTMIKEVDNDDQVAENGKGHFRDGFLETFFLPSLPKLQNLSITFVSHPATHSGFHLEFPKCLKTLELVLVDQMAGAGNINRKATHYSGDACRSSTVVDIGWSASTSAHPAQQLEKIRISSNFLVKWKKSAINLTVEQFFTSCRSSLKVVEIVGPNSFNNRTENSLRYIPQSLLFSLATSCTNLEHFSTEVKIESLQTFPQLYDRRYDKSKIFVNLKTLTIVNNGSIFNHHCAGASVSNNIKTDHGEEKKEEKIFRGYDLPGHVFFFDLFEFPALEKLTILLYPRGKYCRDSLNNPNVKIKEPENFRQLFGKKMKNVELDFQILNQK